MSRPRPTGLTLAALIGLTAAFLLRRRRHKSPPCDEVAMTIRLGPTSSGSRTGVDRVHGRRRRLRTRCETGARPRVTTAPDPVRDQ
jgi:MYXO-CTERM domain-containing protein